MTGAKRFPWVAESDAGVHSFRLLLGAGSQRARRTFEPRTADGGAAVSSVVDHIAVASGVTPEPGADFADWLNRAEVSAGELANPAGDVPNPIKHLEHLGLDLTDRTRTEVKQERGAAYFVVTLPRSISPRHSRINWVPIERYVPLLSVTHLFRFEE